MISNERGSTAPEAPSGVTWGGVPFHARRVMTVAAATLVEDCSALASQASAELERLARAAAHEPLPGQDSLL